MWNTPQAWDYQRTHTHADKRGTVCLKPLQSLHFFPQEFNMAAILLSTSLLHSTDRRDGPALDDILMSVCGRDALGGWR